MLLFFDGHKPLNTSYVIVSLSTTNSYKGGYNIQYIVYFEDLWIVHFAQVKNQR